MVYSEILRELRKKSGYTQIELAEKTGVSRSTVYDWESGKYPRQTQTILQHLKMFLVLTEGNSTRFCKKEPLRSPLPGRKPCRGRRQLKFCSKRFSAPGCRGHGVGPGSKRTGG